MQCKRAWKGHLTNYIYSLVVCFHCVGLVLGVTKLHYKSLFFFNGACRMKKGNFLKSFVKRSCKKVNGFEISTTSLLMLLLVYTISSSFLFGAIKNPLSVFKKLSWYSLECKWLKRIWDLHEGAIVNDELLTADREKGNFDLTSLFSASFHFESSISIFHEQTRALLYYFIIISFNISPRSKRDFWSLFP